MNSDVEELLRAASYAASAAPAMEAVLAVATKTQGDAGALAVEMNRLMEVTRATAASNMPPPRATQAAQATDDTSPVETMLRTVGMMTGVGPVVTGLMKLFGSDSPEPLPTLEKFQMPGQVSVEAGLSASGEYGAIRHTQGGRPEVVGSVAGNTAQPPAIQVNIQAMDTQSFLDRQDDIARAVREAMLHSNSLNDVVMEL
jgi:hypothetical protein